MTLASQMASDVSSVFLNTEEHAEAVTRVPVSGGSASVLAVWEPDEYQSIAGPRVDMSAGRRVERTGRLFISSTQTALLTDTWTINGETWLPEKVGSSDFGCKIVFVKREDLQRTEKSGGTLR